MSKVAVIVETRRHKALEFVLNNVSSNLNEEWKIQIFHGVDNEEYIKNIILKNSLENRIICRNLNTDDLLHNDYVNMFLTKEFWNSCEGDNILIFQTDSIICPNSDFNIDDFIHHDYIGGYWGNQEYPLDEKYILL